MIRKALSFDLSNWPLIAFAGPDRAKSLHNLTTQDIKGLPSGAVAEGFVTSPQGKAIGFFTFFVRENEILLRCAPGGESLAIEHFGKYTIFDDASFEVVTNAYEQRIWLGSEVVEAFWTKTLTSESGTSIGVRDMDLPGVGSVLLARFDEFQVPGILIIAPKGSMNQAEAELANIAGIVPEPGSPELFEQLRVLAAWPRFGIDIQADNLPQEIDRDASAISFRKGCYLGQETVARLDALGHVNRILRCFVLDSDHVPVNPASLANRSLVNEAGQQVGEIRSAAAGENAQQAAGMALVRVKAMDGVVRVADLPEATLTLMTPAEFRDRFSPVALSLTTSANV